MDFKTVMFSYVESFREELDKERSNQLLVNCYAWV